MVGLFSQISKHLPVGRGEVGERGAMRGRERAGEGGRIREAWRGRRNRERER